MINPPQKKNIWEWFIPPIYLWWWLGHGADGIVSTTLLTTLSSHHSQLRQHRHHRLSSRTFPSALRGIARRARHGGRASTSPCGAPSNKWHTAAPGDGWWWLHLFDRKKGCWRFFQKICFSYQLCSHFGFIIGFQFLWIACWMLSNSKKLIAVNYGTRTCVIGSGNTCNCAGSG